MDTIIKTNELTGTSNLDEENLVEQARMDPEAFAILYRRYLPRLYRYLYRKTSNPHEAEDLTAQVFIEALEGLTQGRYRRGGSFPAWLFTIARRRVADFYRKRPAVALGDLPSPEPGLLAALEKSEDVRRLAHLLARLDENRQELLRLRFSAGLSFAEISLIDGRSEAAVKMAFYRTLDVLRIQWEDENG
jgi:RNA polymerase sigma-70 factor (ECF subfamily)